MSPLTLLFSFCQQPQLVVPFRLERISYESVSRVDFHIPSLGQTGFVTGSLDLCLSEAISFFDSFPDFLLDGQRYVQCHWRDTGNQQLADGIVDGLSRDVLTIQTTLIEVLTRTEIIGPQVLAASGVSGVHSLPTDTAQQQTL